jgi:hypothetical protein
MLVAEISLGDVMVAIVVVFFMVVYLMMLFQVLGDLYRSDDLSGAKKAAWALGLLVLPIIVMIAYVVVRGSGIPGRYLDARDEDVEASIRMAGDPAEQLTRAKALLDDGSLSLAQYERLKGEILA